MNAIAARIEAATRTTRISLIAIAAAGVATVALLSGCDDGIANASVPRARESASGVVDAQPHEVYLPRRHEIRTDAAHGNVMTYEHD